MSQIFDWVLVIEVYVTELKFTVRTLTQPQPNPNPDPILILAQTL